MTLDDFEKDIEDNFENLQPITNIAEEIALLKNVASNHSKNRKSITIRIPEMDLEAIRLKASKAGIPYQTYINMLIHQDASHI